MLINNLTLEQARELAKPWAWSVQALLDKLPRVDPCWIRDAVNHGCEDRPELERRIEALMDARTSEPSRLYMGLILFFLARPRGREAFLNGLRSGDATLRKLVLGQFYRIGRDDLGHDGVAGELPASCEEVLTAVVPLLQEPASYQSGVALDFALSEQVFELSRSHTRPLMAHADRAVRYKVVLAYLHNGCDDGALDALVKGSFAPGILLADQSATWMSTRQDACAALRTCVEVAQDPDVRMRAGILALQIVQQTLRARATAGRFPQWSDEGLDADALLQAIALAPPPEAEAVLLHEAVDATYETVQLRSLALLRYFDLTNNVPNAAKDIIDAMVSQADVSPLDDRLEQFVARKMIGLRSLIQAVGNPAWCFMAIQAIDAWPRGPKDVHIVDALTVMLDYLASRTPFQEDALLDCMAELLRRLPRTAAQNQAIVAALKKALEIAKQNAKRPWVAQGVLHQLVIFGDLSVAGDNNIEPWDAMWAHWQREGISWDDAARMLIDVGATDDAARGRTEEREVEDPVYGDEDTFGELGIPGRLRYILGDRCVHVSLKDESCFPQHEIRLEQMAAIVMPSLGAEAFSQTVEWHGESAECQMRFIYENQVYGFSASPDGDWLDTWALIDGLNSFLRNIGRAEQIFRLADPAAWYGEYGILLCANGERFLEMNKHLHLPLQPR